MEQCARRLERGDDAGERGNQRAEIEQLRGHRRRKLTPVCPRLARVITASVIRPIAPVVQAWSPALAGHSEGHRIAAPSRRKSIGTKAYPTEAQERDDRRRCGRRPSAQGASPAARTAIISTTPDTVSGGNTIHGRVPARSCLARVHQIARTAAAADPDCFAPTSCA